MQARYYDPVIGRFLSNDPVGFASGGAGFFNRYAYTANDPVNMVDPNGNEFVFHTVNGGIRHQAAQAMEYLQGASEGARLIGKLDSSDQIISVTIDPSASSNSFNAATASVTWNPTLGLRMGQNGENGISSAASSLAHEFAHAEEMIDVGGPQAMMDKLLSNWLEFEVEVGGPPGSTGETRIQQSGWNPEAYATGTQNTINRQLGEPTRAGYSDTNGYASVPDVTASCRGAACSPE